MLKTRFELKLNLLKLLEKRHQGDCKLFQHRSRKNYCWLQKFKIKQNDGRVWKIAREGSIACQRKEEGLEVRASDEHSVELVSPILTYEEDIKNLQDLVRLLRKKGAFANSSCGIHIHLDGKNRDHRSG